METELAVGQVWRYQTREVEPDSTLIIAKIETDTPHGTVVHIQVRDVQIAVPNRPQGFLARLRRSEPKAATLQTIGHLPFAEDAFRNSLTHLAGTEAAPDISGGYDDWKQNKGGVWTLSVAETINTLAQVMN